MRVVKALLLIFALLVLTELFLFFRPEPALIAGVKLGEGPITEVLRKRFPIGSPASALEDELKREGYWGPILADRNGQYFWHYVLLRRWILLFVPVRTAILWETDDEGRLTSVKGSKFIDITLP